MSEKDYEDILDQNVDEAKEAIEELEDPDYQELLDAEKDGRDRKTVKQFLESFTEEQDDTEETEETENTEEETEIVSEGLLEEYSRNQILSGGLIAGVVIGLIIGFGFTATDSPQATPQEVEDSINSLFDATGEAEQIEISDIEQRNSMYYATIDVEVEMENETETQSESFYVSPDAELLFPEIQDMMMQNPINIEETITQMEQMEGMEDMPEEDLEIEEPGDEEMELEPEDEEIEIEPEDLEVE